MQIVDMPLDTVLSRGVHSAHSTCPSWFSAQCVNTPVNKLAQCFTMKLIDYCSETYGTIFYKNMYLLDKDINITNRLFSEYKLQQTVEVKK